MVVERPPNRPWRHTETPKTGAEGTAANECAPKAGEPAVVPRRVLVIDDHIDTADAIAACLTASGHQVKVALTGEQGLELARRFHPQVVFCDIWLPGLDGYFVTRALKIDPVLSSCYFVAISGAPFREGYKGFNEYLRKPVDNETLLAVMRRATAD
jgi:CheY-like chemotaxis protein